MNASPRSSWLLTVEEYLAFEEHSDVRHEYVGGEIHALAGASEAATDRREKIVEYRKLPSLLCYLVVHQDQRRVERHWRDTPGDPWELDMVVEGAVKIPGLDVTLSLEDIYEGVDIDADV